jgi:hypothetical protein
MESTKAASPRPSSSAPEEALLFGFADLGQNVLGKGLGTIFPGGAGGVPNPVHAAYRVLIQITVNPFGSPVFP